MGTPVNSSFPLITIPGADSIGKRSKKIYQLTKNGKIFAKSMLNRFGEFIDISVAKSLTSCSHCGCKLYKSGYKKMIGNKLLNFCCPYCAKAFDRH